MMNRRKFAAGLVASAAFRPLAKASDSTPRFEPNWKSIGEHKVPDWYQNAKLGIFIHWGLYSVPAWATTSGELGKVDPSKWFTDNAYAEWYLNTLRIKGSPGYEHHIEPTEKTSITTNSHLSSIATLRNGSPTNGQVYLRKQARGMPY